MKALGKITEISFGYGGYQDAQFGLGIYFETTFGGGYDFKGPWARRRDNAEYSKEVWDQQKVDLFDYIRDLLSVAKTDDVTGLVGKPVELTYVDAKLESWRILQEVL